MELTRENILHIAQLSSLSLREDEIEPIANDLRAILKHVDDLNSVDTTNVEATASVSVNVPDEASLRPDEERQSLSNDEALAGAARKSQGGFAVPTFVEG